MTTYLKRTIIYTSAFILFVGLFGVSAVFVSAEQTKQLNDNQLLAQNDTILPPGGGGGGGGGSPPPAACEDGTDNDGDGLVDYPDDPGCDSSGDDSELPVNSGGGGNEDPAPVCGSVSMSDPTAISVNAEDNSNPTPSESAESSHSFADPLLENSNITINGANVSVDANGYDARGTAEVTAKILDDGSVVDQKTESISVNAGPDPGDEQDSTYTNISFPSTPAGIDEVVVEMSVSANAQDTGHGSVSVDSEASFDGVSSTHQHCGGPNANDDGSEEYNVCNNGLSSPQDIDVFDNDSHPNGRGYMFVSDVDSVTDNGGTANIKNADDGVIRYTPSQIGEDTFSYTAEDEDGDTDTAEVTVDVTNDGCGSLTVQVQNQNGDTVSDASFTPKYDTDADGRLEILSAKSGSHTYNVFVDDTPRLSQMNESMIDIPAGYASSSSDIIFEKDVERVVTASGPQDEPDDHTYQNITNKKSKLAADTSGSSGSGLTAALACQESQDQTFVNNCSDFAAVLDASGSSDPDGNLDSYEFASQGGFSETTQHPDADVQACLSTVDNVSVEVSDTDGNSDSVTEDVGDMCPIGGCSEVSVQNDFSGDDLNGSAYNQAGSNDQDRTSDPWSPDPKTATLEISSVLDSGESAGEMTIEFASSGGFQASVSCNGASDPGACGANAELLEGGSVLRSVSADGEVDPSDTDTDNSDLTFNVNDSETVELETSGSATVDQNLNSSAESRIQISDIRLEVCN